MTKAMPQQDIVLPIWLRHWDLLDGADKLNKCATQVVIFVMWNSQIRSPALPSVEHFKTFIDVDNHMLRATRKLPSPIAHPTDTNRTVPLLRDLGRKVIHQDMSLAAVLNEIALKSEGLFLDCIDIENSGGRKVFPRSLRYASLDKLPSLVLTRLQPNRRDASRLASDQRLVRGRTRPRPYALDVMALARGRGYRQVYSRRALWPGHDHSWG